ncbi:holo-[acyl-carrier-protein] synthase [Candidatus Micrarchaeota archaeon]|nr:holo-[acyl-carrier-protein] synthase [Candidatus Micrarchaeota archaeon]
MDIQGLGVDIANIRKMKRILSRKTGGRFVENTFTEAEKNCAGGESSHLATAFAAKEAVYKAFGTGWIEGKDVELVRCRTGAPEVKLYGEIKQIAKKRKIRNIMISVSYTGDYAVAVAVLTS